MMLLHPLKSIAEPASGNGNPFTKKKGVPRTPLEQPYYTIKDNIFTKKNTVYNMNENKYNFVSAIRKLMR